MALRNTFHRALHHVGTRRATVVVAAVALLAGGAVVKAMPAAGENGAAIADPGAGTRAADTVTAPPDCHSQAIFLAQNSPTQLEELVGPPPYQNPTIGGVTPGLTYNALAYNKNDGFLYAVETAPNVGHVLKISTGGAVTDLGDTAPKLGSAFNSGAFGNDGMYYVMSSGASRFIQQIDLSTMTRTGIQISAANVSWPADMALVAGSDSFWGVMSTSNNLVRITPNAPTLADRSARFSITDVVPASVNAGAAWAFGNGNLGLSDNNQGTIYQVHIANPDSASPEAGLIYSGPGPRTNTNDAAACPGDPVDLSITKIATPEPVQANGEVTFTLTVKNENTTGQSSGFAVNDTFPDGVVNPTTTTPGCSTTPGDLTVTPHVPATLTCVEDILAAGQEFGITVTADAPATPHSFTNTATVAGNESEPDGATANNTASSQTMMTAADTAVPDLVINKSATPTTVNVGETVTWTLTVRNTSATATTADTATVTDHVPAGVTDVTVTSATAGTDCSASTGNTVSCTLPTGMTSDPADDAVITVTGTATQAAAPTIVNTATVVGGGDTTPGDSRSITRTTVRTADLALTKTASPEPASVGDAVTWTLTVTNNGPVSTTDVVTVTDDVPASIQNPSLVTNPNGQCAFDPNNTLTCTLADPIGAGEHVDITFTGTATADAAPAVQNTASASGGGDPKPPADATWTTTVNTADVSLTKSSAPTTASVGQPITWTYTIHNQGAGDAVGATLTDTLPATVTIQPDSLVQPAGAGCSIAGQTLTCHPDRIADGADLVIMLSGTPGANAGDTVINTATVTQPGDPNTGDNSDSSTTRLLHADLSVTKTAPEHVHPGGQIQWLITVHNAGPGTAYGATLHDPVPAGMSNVHLAPAVPGCTVTGHSLDCTFSPIPKGQRVLIRLVGDTTHTGTVTNTVTVHQPGDPTSANNTARTSTRVTPRDEGSGYPPCRQHSTDPAHCSGPEH